MMKLVKTVQVAGILALILVAETGFAEDISGALKKIGSDAGKTVVGASRRAQVASSDSLQEAIAAIEDQLKDEEAIDQAETAELELRGKIQKWNERSGTVKKIDDGFDALAAKQIKQKKASLEASKAAAAKLPSKAAAGFNSSVFTTPAKATPSCTKNTNMSGLKQVADSFMSGPVKRVTSAMMATLTAESKKAQKAADAELLKALDSAKKDIKAQEDPKLKEILDNPFPVNADDITWEKRQRFLEAANAQKKQNFSEEIVKLVEKHGPKLAKARTDKSLMAEVIPPYLEEWEKDRAQFEQVAIANARAAYQNCLDVAEAAGVIVPNSNNNLANNGQVGQVAAIPGGGSPYQALAASLGGAMGGAGALPQFAQGSSALRAMDMMALGYRKSLNLMAVVPSQAQYIARMLQQIQCQDMTPQITQLTEGVKTVVADVANATEKDLPEKVQRVNEAMAGMMTSVANLQSNPSQSDASNTMLGQCEFAQNTKRLIDNFGQGQAQLASGAQVGGQYGAAPRAGTFPQQLPVH